MFNTQIIDVAVSLCFIYLLYATIVTTVVEIINTLTKARAKMLKKSIEDLLFNDQWKAIRGDILKSPYILSLQRTEDSFPSYIPAKNFTLAVLGALNDNQKNGITLDNLPPELKPLFQNVISLSENKIESISESIETFYDNAMERVTGWFKRRSQIITFIISLIIAVGFNVDSVRITKTLWQDKPALEKSVQMAIKYAGESESGNKLNVKAIQQYPVKDTLTNKNESENNLILKNISPDNIRQDTLLQNLKDETGKINGTLITISEIPIPIGWISENQKEMVSFKYWIIKISGLLLTTLAIYLGAPFWFDLMNKFINLRGTFKKPEDKKPNA